MIIFVKVDLSTFIHPPVLQLITHLNFLIIRSRAVGISYIYKLSKTTILFPFFSVCPSYIKSCLKITSLCDKKARFILP